MSTQAMAAGAVVAAALPHPPKTDRSLGVKLAVFQETAHSQLPLVGRIHARGTQEVWTVQKQGPLALCAPRATREASFVWR